MIDAFPSSFAANLIIRNDLRACSLEMASRSRNCD
jgi:hypothetical protein